MAKLTKWLSWIDEHILKILVIGCIFIIPLLLKYPIKIIDYTYIAFRYDDLYIGLILFVFAVQLIRKKVRLDKKWLLFFSLFWAGVFLSYLFGYFIQKTVIYSHLGFLHSARRVEYMALFFVGVASVKSKQDFYHYLYATTAALALVCLYGFGQKFLGFPALQTMNSEFAKGQLLYLTPEARVSSTFAGHYDLAGYLVLLMPIMIGLHLYTKKFVFFIAFLLALGTLILTASRISYGAYIASVFAFLIYARKPKYLIIITILTVVATLFSSNLTQRFLKTFQIKQIFVNEKTGQVVVPQKITSKELPAGTFYVNIDNKNVQTTATANTEKLLQEKLLRDVREEASKSGKKLTSSDEANLVATMSANLKPVNSVSADISLAARLQAEWPRAISSFLKNPILGTGPSSITESTDNDFLRWIGEFGLFATSVFLFILFRIGRHVFDTAARIKGNEQLVLYGFIFGLGALLMNASYIDVFEASKVAYSFWLLAGIFIGVIPFIKASKKNI
ncbi:hypothetical protein HGA88_05895 [Candidatus Roizmanbacteria bacterium]|nr:hypothetical protein [Candidatus Roizmanbacteria bacterium]